MNIEGQCVSCGLDRVLWVETRGGRFRHEGGRASCRFPCDTCTHIDCAEARGGVEEQVRVATKLGIGLSINGETILSLEGDDDMATAKTKTKNPPKTKTSKAKAKTGAKARKAKAKAKAKAADLPKTKTCSGCKKTRGIDKFYLIKGKPSTYCKECYREKNRQWREKKKKEA